jgi:hypothetical protein
MAIKFIHRETCELLKDIRPVQKKELYKLNPGAVVIVAWNDNEPTVGILLEKMTPGKGDVNLHLLHRFSHGNEHDRRAYHEQIIYVVSDDCFTDFRNPLEEGRVIVEDDYEHVRSDFPW